jgi:hypothetical protein
MKYMRQYYTDVALQEPFNTTRPARTTAPRGRRLRPTQTQ